MQTHFFEEPQLEFAHDFHVCPRFGISEYDAYDCIDSMKESKPDKITVGVISTAILLEQFEEWLNRCIRFVDAKQSKQPNLFTSFPGFSLDRGFKCGIVSPSEYRREINNSDIEQLISSLDLYSNKEREAVGKMVAEMYLAHIKFLVQVRNPDVIVCILPNKLVDKVLQLSSEDQAELDRTSISDNENTQEKDMAFDFRCFLKAKAMKYNVPIQILKESTIIRGTDVSTSRRSLQDMATCSWNFFTALYYKAGGIPWKAIETPRSERTCYVGISFYKSLDGNTLHTSSAQMFDELGKGVILRGGEAVFDEKNRIPYLDEKNAYTLLNDSITSYNFAQSSPPKRIVIHKSSGFTTEEINGFKKALSVHRISTHDFITIYPASHIKLFRQRQYPPLRGTFLKLADSEGIFYTRGSVDFYRTYPGLYIPSPIHIRVAVQNSSIKHLCNEILSLTKMNWNNTQFDRKFPITIQCSRSVGNILKYLDNTENAENRYSFYM